MPQAVWPFIAPKTLSKHRGLKAAGGRNRNGAGRE